MALIVQKASVRFVSHKRFGFAKVRAPVLELEANGALQVMAQIIALPPVRFAVQSSFQIVLLKHLARI